MPLMLSGEELFRLRRDFTQMCCEASVFDEKHRWVSLDRLWWEVDRRAQFAELTASYLDLLIQDHPPEQTVIVSPDTISSSFGITPVVFIAGERLGYPVAVWQELGDFAANKPIMIGTRRPHLMVRTQPTRRGTTTQYPTQPDTRRSRKRICDQIRSPRRYQSGDGSPRCLRR